MHMRTRSVTAPLETAIRKLLQSKLKVELNSITSYEIIDINTLIQRNNANGKATILTFSSGPFKTTQELPTDWMKTPSVNGCSAQLAGFQKKFEELNAVVIGLNKQSADYQRGANGLLAVKNLANLNMISDENNKIENELELSDLTVKVNGKSYFKHFSLVITPNNVGKGFMLQSPVTEEIINNHIEDIKLYIEPTLTKKIISQM